MTEPPQTAYALTHWQLRMISRQAARTTGNNGLRRNRLSRATCRPDPTLVSVPLATEFFLRTEASESGRKDATHVTYCDLGWVHLAHRTSHKFFKNLRCAAHRTTTEKSPFSLARRGPAESAATGWRGGRQTIKNSHFIELQIEAPNGGRKQQ